MAWLDVASAVLGEELARRFGSRHENLGYGDEATSPKGELKHGRSNVAVSAQADDKQVLAGPSRQFAVEDAIPMIDEPRTEDTKSRFKSHGEMNTAYLSGRAVPLAQSVSWLVRYQESWWVVYEGGWLRVTDDLVEADIDSCASRLT